MSTLTIYIPDNDNTQDHDFVHIALREFSIVAGGATATKGTGAWVDNDGRLEVEPVTLIRSFVDDDKLPDLYDEAVAVADLLLNVGEQAVALEIDGELTLIEEQSGWAPYMESAW